MKIRLINGGHSLLGFMGSLFECKKGDEAVSVPLISEFLRNFMDREVTPVPGTVEGINLTRYKDILIQRYVNPCVKDNLSRVCMERPDSIPKFVLPKIRENTEKCAEIVMR